MATHTADFWPDDIGQSDLRTPVSLLREQAVALGEKTKNVVTAEVTSSAAGEAFTHFLVLLAPAVNYRYQLITIQHPITLYPMTAMISGGSWARIDSEDGFIQWLKAALTSDKTKGVIRALIAQAQGS
jgi:hypothetical protein